MTRRAFGFPVVRLVAAALVFGLSAGAAAPEPDASFVAVNREASLDASDKTSSARVGGAVPEGATVFTGAGNTARVALADGAVVEIEQRTRATFERVRVGGEGVRILLASGTIRLDAASDPHGDRRTFTVLTAQARIVFLQKKGYVTSSNDQDVVTCLRCHVYDRAQCDRNDFTVRDASACQSLSDGSVAIITRQHGIQLQSDSAEAMVRTVIEGLGGQVALASEGAPWWKARDPSGDLSVERSEVALDRPGSTAELTAEGRPDAGNIWWLSADPRVAVVDDVDPAAGTCKLRAAGPGQTAVIAFDQLGRYAAVRIDVREGAER
jgi:hypothetical protein